jgi:hypothetical protein
MKRREARKKGRVDVIMCKERRLFPTLNLDLFETLFV